MKSGRKICECISWVELMQDPPVSGSVRFPLKSVEGTMSESFCYSEYAC